MNRARTARIAGMTLAAAVSLAACGSARPAAFGGGNNAPHQTAPATTTTTTAPPATTTTTVPPTTVPGPIDTVEPGTVVTAPGGVHSAFGTPQTGKPWLTAGTPTYVAAEWTIAYHELLWTQPVVAGTGLSYYIHRITPYSTPAWLATLSAPVKAVENTGTAAPGDAQIWAQIVHTQTDKTVQIIEANRVDQAGWTATSEVVQVTFFYQVTTAAHPNPQPGLQIGLTTDYLTMDKIGGRWLVSHEINALDS